MRYLRAAAAILIFNHGLNLLADTNFASFPNDAEFSACESNALAQFNGWNNGNISQGATPGKLCIETFTYPMQTHIWYRYTNPGDSCIWDGHQGVAGACIHTEPEPGMPGSAVTPLVGNPKSGNKNICPVKGSFIDPSKKTVSESISIDGTNLTITYSSEFASKRLTNKSVYDQFSLNSTGFASSRIKITNLNANSSDIIGTAAVNGNVVVKWPWNGTQGNTATHPALSSGLFNVALETPVSIGASPNGSNVQSHDCRNVCFSVVGSTIDPITFDEQIWNSAYEANQMISIYHPEVWGLGGWTLSNHHFFDRNTKILYRGTGEKKTYKTFKTITLSGYGSVDVVSSQDENEMFIFSPTGEHLETRTKILKAIKYKFTYQATTRKLLSYVDINNKQTQIIYDTNGKINKIIAPYGQQTLFTVSQNLVTGIQNSINQNYSMQYDSNALLTQFAKPNLEVTQFSYDADGDFVSETKNTGLSQSFASSVANAIQTLVKTTALEIKSIFTVSQSGNTTTTDQKNGNNVVVSQAVATSYGQTSYIGNNVLEFTEYSDVMWGNYVENNYPSTATYQEAGQTITEHPYEYVSYTYSTADNPTTVTAVDLTRGYQGSSDVYNSHIDVSTKLMTSTDPAGRVFKIYFNAKEQVARIEPDSSVAQIFTYDTSGRLSKSQKGTSYENYAYDANGFLNTITTSKGQVTTFLRDTQGNILTKTLPNLDTVQFEYSAGGEVKKIITPAAQSHNFQMSIGDYISGYLTPANKQTSYTYDADKRITGVTQPSGRTIGYAYTAGTDHLSQVTTTEGNYVYQNTDAQGRPAAVISADSIKTEFNWISSQVQQQKWYDTDGSVIGTLSYMFDTTRFRMNQILLNGSAIGSYNYNAYTGKLDSIYDANNSAFNYTYQLNSTISEQVSVAAGSLNYVLESQDSSSGNKPFRKATFGYADATNNYSVTMTRTFDNFGLATDYTTNVLNTTTNKVSSYYQLIPTYDVNDRLAQTQKVKKIYVGTTLTTQTEFYNQYTFAAGSNNNISQTNQRLTLTSTPTKGTASTYGVDDQLLTTTGTLARTYTYDNDGHMLTMTDSTGTTNYVYDDFSNLKKITYPSGKVIDYKVDGLNRRVKKLINGVVSEYYLWYDQIHMAAILDANKIVQITYLYGPDSNSPSLITKGGVTYKVISDPGLGSIRYVVDPATLMVAQEIEYDELGNMVKNTDPSFQPITFAGGLSDTDSKLIRFGTRDYDSSVGRFTTKDTIGFNGDDTNLYNYCGNNPMSCVDPEGTFWVPVAIGIGLFLNPTYLDTAGAALTEIYDGMRIAGAGLLAQLGPLLTDNRYLRIGEGKFPEPYSQRISIGNTPGKKFEIGISPKGRIDVKLGGSRTTIRNGSKDICPKE